MTVHVWKSMRQAWTCTEDDHAGSDQAWYPEGTAQEPEVRAGRQQVGSCGQGKQVGSPKLQKKRPPTAKEAVHAVVERGGDTCPVEVPPSPLHARQIVKLRRFVCMQLS